jgi:hypothetical protein
MKPLPIRVTRITVALFTAAGLVLAQDQAPQPPADQTPHAWRSVNDALPADLAQASQAAPAPQADQAQAAPQPYPQQTAPAQQYNYPPPGAQPYPAPAGNYGVPARLTIKPGTYVTVRINQWLSSDRNQKGDTFTATLEQPIVVDGFVVAQPGQTVYGRVTEAQKAGRVEGTSKLGVELTQLTLVDGDQMSVQSAMINRNGPTSVGRDAAAIGVTTGLGAAVGAAADLGRGAAIGAGAGAAVGILGVLLTRGRPTVIYPETALTFQVQAPVEIATDKAPQAFQYVNAQQGYPGGGYGGGYGQRPPAYATGPVPPPPGAGYGYGPGYAPPYPYYGGYAYGYPYPYFGFGVVVGRGFYGPGYYGGFRGGFYRR